MILHTGLLGRKYYRIGRKEIVRTVRKDIVRTVRKEIFRKNWFV